MIERIQQQIWLDQNPWDFYDLLEPIGEGSYGTVYKAKSKQTQELWAIKVIPIKNEEEFELCLKELSILEKSKNRFVVRYFETFFLETDFWIVLEYCDGGSAKQILKTLKERQESLDEDTIQAILYFLIQGISHLHSIKMIHRDIKADNILLNFEGFAKISDFGVSTQLANTFASQDSVIGSPFWMSPEILNRNKYNNKTDIWSIGVTAIELAENEPPFHQYYPYIAIQKIRQSQQSNLSQPEKWSSDFQDFVHKCLIQNPKERASIKDLLIHPFILGGWNKNHLIIQMLQQYYKEICQNETPAKKRVSNKDKSNRKNSNGNPQEKNIKNKSKQLYQTEVHSKDKNVEKTKKRILEIQQEQKWIEKELEINPKVKILQIQATIQDVQKQYEEVIKETKWKYEATISDLELYLALWREKIKLTKTLPQYESNSSSNQNENQQENNKIVSKKSVTIKNSQVWKSNKRNSENKMQKRASKNAI